MGDFLAGIIGSIIPWPRERRFHAFLERHPKITWSLLGLIAIAALPPLFL